MRHAGHGALEPSTLATLAMMALWTLTGGRSLRAQEAAEAFDIGRAYVLEEQVYAPFLVEETEPLAAALEQGRVDGETSLLVMEHPAAGRLALVTDQMAYHHVAQGRISGEPWMVSF